MKTAVKRIGLAGFVISCLLFLWLLPEESRADPSIERQKALLEKGLTLHEIDRELERIRERELELQDEIRVTEELIAEQEIAMQDEKERAGNVLRAYYTGERGAFFTVFLQMDRLSELLTVIEYIQVIFESDREAIRRYSDSSKALKETVTALKQTEAELQEVKQLYLEQRQIAAEMQDELDSALAATSEAQQIEEKIEQLTKDWEENGIPLFRRYFQALSAAMNDLPEILEDGEYLTVKGLTWEFQMSDHALNAFLHKKNEMFEQITFRFEDDRIIAEGTAEERSLFIGGEFAIFDTPVHHIGFKIVQLEYEGFSLPDSTAREMEEQFDLAFYPKALVPFVRAKEIEMKDGSIHILLELDFESTN